MAQEDENASEVDHAKEVVVVKLVANDQAAKVLQPSEETFDLPATAVAAERSAILGGILPVASMGRDHFDAQRSQFSIQTIGFIRGIAD